MHATCVPVNIGELKFNIGQWRNFENENDADFEPRVRDENMSKLNVCDACDTGFRLNSKFKEHVLKCVGAGVTQMNFDATHSIQFDKWCHTLRCPVFGVLDVETTSSTVFQRRRKKSGKFFKDDIAKERKLILVSFGLHFRSSEIEELNFSIYKSLHDPDDLWSFQFPAVFASYFLNARESKFHLITIINELKAATEERKFTIFCRYMNYVVDLCTFIMTWRLKQLAVRNFFFYLEENDTLLLRRRN